MGRARAVIVGGLAIALAVAGSPSTAAVSGKLLPSSGAWLGAWVDPDARWSGDAAARADVAALESRIGRKLDINQHYYAWGASFPTTMETWDVANGRIPLITWQGATLSRIISGSQDAIITARARAVKALGAKVFLRWGWEMNGNWFAWDGTHNNGPGMFNGPAKYVAAYRRIHDIFVRTGATNAVWVWSPNHESVPNASWNHWRKYYPGAAYVDWVGIDAYNWGKTRSWSSWKSLSTLIKPIYDVFAASKPVMICETASTEVGGDKATWIRAARSALKTSFPSVKAFLWFNSPTDNDWPLESSRPALDAFRVLASDLYFRRGV